MQSLYSIADGGIFGTGFGRGFVLVGKQTVIPDAQTDFIFSVIATETGLGGRRRRSCSCTWRSSTAA